MSRLRLEQVRDRLVSKHGGLPIKFNSPATLLALTRRQKLHGFRCDGKHELGLLTTFAPPHLRSQNHPVCAVPGRIGTSSSGLQGGGLGEENVKIGGLSKVPLKLWLKNMADWGGHT